MNAAFLLKLPPSGAGQPVRIGFSPPADSAPQLIVRDLDLLSQHGVIAGMSCETGLATIRKKLLYCQLDQTKFFRPRKEVKLLNALFACWASCTLAFPETVLAAFKTAKIKKRNQLAYA